MKKFWSNPNAILNAAIVICVVAMVLQMMALYWTIKARHLQDIRRGAPQSQSTK